MTENILNFLDDIVKKSLALGASDAEAAYCQSNGNSTSCRLGKIEDVEAYESTSIGVRVFIGKKQVSLSASGKTPEIAQKLIDRSMAMVKLVPEDEYCGLADGSEILKKIPNNLDLYDNYEPDFKCLNEITQIAEEAALSNKQITNSEGAGAGFSKNAVYVVSSNGFASSFQKSTSFISASVIAGNGDNNERAHDSSSAIYFNDLEKAEIIGQKAAERAEAMLGAKKIKTGIMPVIFDSRIASSLLSHFASAASGKQIARGASFLKDMMMQEVFNEQISIIDDPLIIRGRKSKPFDAEGLPCKKEYMVEQGILKNWFLDLSSARKLGLKSLGQASMSLGGSPYPSPSNLYIANGSIKLNDICQDYPEVLLITSLSGQGVNITNGNYSRGVKGFILQKGEKAYPVSEITVSGNLTDIFKKCIPLNDLEFRYGLNSPSLFVNEMMIAGK